MKKNTLEVVATAVFAAIILPAQSVSAQERAPDPVEESTEAGGNLVIREFAPGKKVVIGETPILVFEKHSVVQGKQVAPATGSTSTASPSRLQSAEANERALEAWVQKRLGAEETPAKKGSVIRIGNGELFKAGSGKLSDQGQKTLGNVAAMINRQASPEVNLVVNAEPMLAKKRANAVRNYLAKSSKITVDQVKVVKSIEGIPAKEARFATNILVLDRS